jgi:hypothetical protein
MKTYLVYWPNKTITVASAEDEVDLFNILDEEGDPEQAEIFILPRIFSVTTHIQDGGIASEETISNKDLKRFKFSDDILGKTLA